MSVFVATLPPELWRECMRWATLPPSGRSPLDDSLTVLDPWPVDMPPMSHDRYLHPEIAYGFEQARLYPTKRALMLVSKAWAELAVEFMYESIVIGCFGVGRLDLIAVLEGSAGSALKKWVKRVDIFRHPHKKDYACEGLARIGLPNLRVQNMFYYRSLEIAPFGILLSEQPLHLVEPCGSPILDRLKSRGEAFGSLRCLTLWMLEPLPTPFHLPSNLRRLTIIIGEIEYFRVQTIFSTRDSVALPNLTHLTLHHRAVGDAPDRIMRSMEIINHIGPQLRHLTLTDSIRNWTRVHLRTILRVCTQLTELVIPSLLSPWEATPSDFGHSILQTLGIPIPSTTYEWYFQPTFAIFSGREAFPKLSIIRLVLWREERAANQWLAPYALRLRGHGIRLEDYWGRPLPRVPVLED